MERGVYFDGWFPHQHCYHPSLPARRLRMVEELTDMRATVLVWAALGGGSISLPYLEAEAFGPIPERFRIHGFVNDAEFVAACSAAGIEVFGVVFEAQGWEFPAEVADGRVLALNELRGAGERTWVGLREFTASTGPADWKPFEHYFPGGLRDSDGQVVTDLWEECCCRDLEGEPIRAHWVESPDRDHVCRFMDRNNPVWREYLKAVVRIQIDAGVAGVQLDESETPFGALGYGGCFCTDCMKQFRDWLRALDPAPDPALFPAELGDVHAADFDYARCLRELGFRAHTPVMSLPGGELFVRFNAETFVRHFVEIAEAAREYAASRGRGVKVAGNFYNGNPEFDVLVDHVDVLVSEMHAGGWRQPWWFRHVEGFGRGREVLVAENPYGGVIPELVAALGRGRGADRLRACLYEGAAMGTSMTAPFGSWMGSEIQDSFWAPKEVLDGCGQFLASVDHLRSRTSRHEVAVLYPVADAMRAEIEGARWAGGTQPDFEAAPADTQIAYWHALRALADRGIAFDCIPLPEEGGRPNDVTAERLARYAWVVAPDCATVSPEQHAGLARYVAAGGRLVAQGRFAVGLGADLPGATRVGTVQEAAAAIDPQVVCDPAAEVAVALAALPEGGSALHLVNYGYDTDRDVAVPLERLAVRLRLPHPVTGARLWRPGCDPVDVDVQVEGSAVRTVLPDVGIYAVVELR